MKTRRDIELGDWRRRAQRGARDIAVAVALTVTAAALIGVAWLGNTRSDDRSIGPSAGVIR
ncbi:MAG: hypothetical protein AB7O57_05235 [Hyphomicrobiaceae bacterium]